MTATFLVKFFCVFFVCLLCFFKIISASGMPVVMFLWAVLSYNNSVCLYMFNGFVSFYFFKEKHM